MEKFVKVLQEYKAIGVFNPWSDYDPLCDIGPQAPDIRAANLLRYLTLRKNAKYLFVAEGLGYQGGHFSGMAMTSERILLGFHPQISPEAVLGEWDYQRTSNPNSLLLSKKQSEEGFNEPTATIMWGQLEQQGISPFQSVLWNMFPFHPYKESGILTNRTPSKEELDVGMVYAKTLLALIPSLKIIAVGQKSANTLAKYGVACSAVPHPSMGGANRFKAAIKDMFYTES